MGGERVSIAMATYNGARFVRAQLESFVAQSRQPDELIVSDDGSADETVDIVEDFRAAAPFPVRVLRSASNVGYSKNFERALRRATGEIVFLSDQDDLWFPEKIAHVLDAFDAPSVQVVIHNVVNAQADLGNEGVTLLDNIVALGFGPAELIVGCATAVRRTWLDCALPIPEEIAHDAWLNGLAHRVGARKVIVKPLALYRRHDNTVFDWVASSPWRVNRSDIPRVKTRDDFSTRWATEARALGLYADRIRRNAGFLEARGLGERADRAAAAFEHRKAAIDARTDVRERPRRRRLPGIAKMLRGRQYRHFGGLWDAIKDSVR